MARCPTCGSITPLGCNCLYADSDSYTIDDTGEDGCLQLEPIINPDPDNLVVCTAAGIGAFLPDSITNPPACKVYKTTSTTIPNNTATFLSFDAIYYDTDTMHSGVNPTRITFTTAGTYVVNFNCAWNKSSDPFREAFIRVNGNNSITIGADEKNAGDADLFVGHSITVMETFNAGDYIEAAVQQATGGNLVLVAESYSPTFAAAKL